MIQEELEEHTAALSKATRENRELKASLATKTEEVGGLKRRIRELISPPCRYGKILRHNEDNSFDVSVGDSRWRVCADPTLIGKLEKGQEVALRDGSYSIVKIRESQKESDLEEAIAKSTKLQDIYERFRQNELPKTVRDRINEELERVATLSVSHSDSLKIITYLDWLSSLPWTRESKTESDITMVEERLSKTHYGLEGVKRSVLRFLAAEQRLKEAKGESISFGYTLCLVGPPGTGKTSIARSVAVAMNREFIRISLGGVSDQSEIRGHGRTYLGSRPGRIIQEICRAGVRNPLIFLDDIDKISHKSAQGDPGAALLELLDPMQNREFVDHYIEIGFDFSKSMFIAAANNVEEILPPPLRDRMHEIPCPAYSEKEKILITSDHIIPAVKFRYGFTDGDLTIEDPAIKEIIREYSDMTTGMRGVEKTIARICGEIAYRLATSKKHPPTRVTVEDLPDILKW